MYLFPGARQEPVPSHSGPMTAHLGPVMHQQAGMGDCFGEFDNPANQASSTGWISKAGDLVQYVDADLIAWTQAGGNSTYNGFECEGGPEALTDAQILTFARVYVAGHLHYSWPLVISDTVGVPGFILHSDGGAAWGGHTSCPGPVRAAQRSAILYIAALALATPVPPRTTQGADMFTRVGSTDSYWIVKPDGSVWGYGPAAGYHGGLNAGAPVGGGAMQQPGEVAIAIESSASGNGYAILSSADNLFCFGDFAFHGHP